MYSAFPGSCRAVVCVPDDDVVNVRWRFNPHLNDSIPPLVVEAEQVAKVKGCNVVLIFDAGLCCRPAPLNHSLN